MKLLYIQDIEHNIYYQDNKELFLELKCLVETHPDSFSSMLKRTGYKKLNGKIIYNAKNDRSQLLNWITLSLPLLSDPFYTLATKCNWIFNNRQSFPICPTCKSDANFKLKNIGVFGNYQTYCCKKCAENSENKKQKALNTLHNNFGADLKLFKDKIRKGWEKHSQEDTQNIVQKRRHTKLIRYNDPNFTNRELAKQTTLKHFGVDNPFQSKEILSKIKDLTLERYGVKYFLEAKEIQEKSKQTIFNIYGVFNVALSPKIISKMHKRYKYNDILFDSGWEICYYEYLVDHNINFIYHPDTHFIYYINGKLHHYIPDFYLADTLLYIEIKGDNHFTDKKPIYNNKYDWSEKYLCMLNNNVIILLASLLQDVFSYITTKHNMNYKKYVKLFKNN